MFYISFLLSLLVMSMGILGLFSPALLIILSRSFKQPSGFFTAIVLRLVFGASLVISAPISHAPEPIRIVGVVIFIAGCVMPFIGLKRFKNIIDWWTSWTPSAIRVWAFFAIAIGFVLARSLL